MGLRGCVSKVCGSEVRWGDVGGVWIGGKVVRLRNESTRKGNSPWVCVWHSLNCGWSSDYREGVDQLRLAWRRGWSSVWVSELGDLFSLSLSLFARLSPKMVWSENRNVNQFPGQSRKTHGQMKCFSGKLYFPCATKHTVGCKIIPWNGFTPTQMQPKCTITKCIFSDENFCH